jgi:hypothetical protein
VSFPSEPGRDDGSLPPVNIEIPDDARDLERDVLAYRREMRAARRRQRLLRLVRPFSRPGFGGHAAIVPLIAVCLALTLVGGALLSVATISPAAAPTLSSSPAPPAGSSADAGQLTSLPQGTVELDGRLVPARSLTSSVIALVPGRCGCDEALRQLAAQAAAAQVGLYFVATGAAIPQLAALTARDGGGTARGAADTSGVFRAAYSPAGLTVLLVYRDATAEVRRNVSAGFRLDTTRDKLLMTGRGQAASPPAVSPATAG